MGNLNAAMEALKNKADPQSAATMLTTKELLEQMANASMTPINNTPSVVLNGSAGSWEYIREQMQKVQAQIKAERIAQGLTQRQLAYKADMSQGTITRAEKHGWISITCLLKIATALGKEIKLN
jgi:DNA-binding XRE family transcriptional regulator